jgi:hypothetical protein
MEKLPAAMTPTFLSRAAGDELEIVGPLDRVGDGAACPAGDAGDPNADHVLCLVTLSSLCKYEGGHLLNPA